MRTARSHPVVLGYNHPTRSMLRTFVFTLLLVASVSAGAQGTLPIPPAPAVAAKTWLLLDYQSQQVIASQRADQRVEPASLTKLMTAYLVFTALKQKQLTLTQPLPVSARAWQMPGSRMFIERDKPVTVDELLHGMIVQSGNDATVALAEGVAGSEDAFVQLMNAQAQRMGLTGTRFANATGLPAPEHYATTADLAKLASAVIRDFPEFFPLYSLRGYTYNRITQSNRNLLLGRDPHVDGMKTGHTESAGYCLIATARRDNRRLIAIVTGTASESARATEAQKLLNYGFQFYDTVRVYEKGATVAELRVWKGSESIIKAGFDRDLYVSVPRGQGNLLKAKLESQQPLVAPVSRQQSVAVLRVTFDDKPVADYPVVALESVGVAGIIGRAWDTLRLLFK
jgi:D-alanyl-D-alanine carboxypeptidase (penicillin-binding protein 5/6)